LKKTEIIEVSSLRILVVILQLVFLKIYTNYTSVYELGIYYFLFTLSYSLNAFLLVPMDYFQQSQLYSLKKSNYSIRSFFKINIWVAKFTFITLFIGLIICLLVNIQYIIILPIIIILALSTYMVTLLRGIINNLEKRRFAIYTLLMESVLKIAFYYIVKCYFNPDAITILVSILLSSLVTLLILYLVIKSLDEFKNEKIKDFSAKEILQFSYPISVGAVVNWIQLQGYRMILVPLGLVEIVGIYGTVANVGTSGMSALSTVYSQLFVPNLYKSEGAYIKTYLKYALLSIIVVLCVGYFLSDIIIGVLTKSEFVKYSCLIVFGVLSEGGNFLIAGLTIYLTIKNLTKVSMIASITGLIVFFLSFIILYVLKKINVYTIGLPIVLTQVVITFYLGLIVYNINRKKTL
jgi:O-antigen/teichoic acid export membrane protein